VSAETAQHRELKRRALAWAWERGYRLAAQEVSLPQLRFRIDVAAYRPETAAVQTPNGRRTRAPVLGTTAIFECKQARSDFLNDGRRIALLTQRLAILAARKTRHEVRLRLQFPSLRNGDTLFSEYESCDYAHSGDELYLRDLRQLETAARQLHAQTKFEKLTQWHAANLHYIVAEPGLLRPHELPDGWGLLVRNETGLDLVAKPRWHEVSESSRLTMLQQIAAAGTRLTYRDFGLGLGPIGPLGPIGS
jgi:hypothetical protein